MRRSKDEPQLQSKLLLNNIHKNEKKTLYLLLHNRQTDGQNSYRCLYIKKNVHRKN